MSIYVCGDVHGTNDIRKLNSRNWPEKKVLTKSDTLIQLGDFGHLWTNVPDRREKWWIKWFDEQPYTTAIVPGNHENYHRINALPEEEKWGGTVKRVSKSIFILNRGEIYTIEGKTFFAFGGAQSTDKEWRVIDVSWWEDELPSKAEEDHGLDSLNAVGNEVDFIVTHTAPADVVGRCLGRWDRYNDPVSNYLSFIEETTEYGDWHFGHLHEDKSFGKFHCHYNAKPKKIV
jgi:hypothetical protein